MNKSQWSTADFDAMSWHDVHVHGFRLVDAKPDEGVAAVIFDIDYILKWSNSGGRFSFEVAQASLRFHDVFDFRFSLDYKARTAGMCAFSLAGIERRSVVHPTGLQSFHWEMDINWPTGRIEFEAPGFTQVLVGPVHTQAEQSLDARLRI